MALILEALVKILRKPSLAEVAVELAAFVATLWIVGLAGMLLGWAWRPWWAAGLVGRGCRDPPTPPAQSLNSTGSNSLAPPARFLNYTGSNSLAAVATVTRVDEGSSESVAVGHEDLEYLFRLVEKTDGGPVWHKMMDKSLPNMSYKAWRRDHEDDENGWDDMLLQHTTLNECKTTRTMVVQWVRKFPFFCSDREYIIGCRIWESGRTYYCITKGVPCSDVPRRSKPRRVDLYYSSWCIREVESKRDGRMIACEVLLFHYEDMGIPWEIAKLGVRQGMWGCVRKIEPGLRAYQVATKRLNGPLSQFALMSQINTKFDADQLRSPEASADPFTDAVKAEKPKNWATSIPRFLIVGGAVAIACSSLDHGLLTKAVIFGVARRFAKIGKRL